tara:strand:+ start:1110 stop:2108 length:999 start_codon:yes stop_codon:yes gene_type:complete
MTSSGIPFVELYRPTKFDDVVLDEYNKKILQNVINTSYFPNFLFYGPPGTGKTTTIINLINAYQTKLNGVNKELIIHLNASDERGVDIIRNQINCFVNSKPLFNAGMKFVVLDEVDYMTKSAQQALRYLLQNYSNDVRFCLICNYISKIDEGLQNEFIRLRFNQLPSKDVINFLTSISVKEKLNISPKMIENIQQMYKSDIRSMINFMQSNAVSFKHDNKEQMSILDNHVLENIFNNLLKKENIENVINIEKIILHINTINEERNIDKKKILTELINYIIRNHPKYISSKILNFTENLMHTKITNHNIYLKYSIFKLTAILSADEHASTEPL